MTPPNLPGYYYDTEKKKYFKIMKGGIPDSNRESKYHHNSVQAERRMDSYNKAENLKPKFSKESNSKQLHQLMDASFRLNHRFLGLTDLKLGNYDMNYADGSSFIYDQKLSIPSPEVHIGIIRLHKIYTVDKDTIKIFQVIDHGSTEYFQIGIQKNNDKMITVPDTIMQRFCLGVNSIYPDSYILFDESSISSMRFEDGFLIFTTYTVGTRNFLSLRKILVTGKVDDYTVRLLLFLRKKCQSKHILGLLRPLVDLPYVNFPESMINLDENRLIDNWTMNNPGRIDFSEDFTTLFSDITHSYSFDDNTYTSSVNHSYIDENQLIINTKVGSIIRITFDAQLNFKRLDTRKFRSVQSFSVDRNLLYVYSSNCIQILFDDLTRSFEIPIPNCRKVLPLTGMRFAVLAKDHVYHLHYHGDINFDFDKTELTVNKVCRYFNKNDPNQKMITLNNTLIINETESVFKVINFNQMANGISKIVLDRTFEGNNLTLNSMIITKDFPIELQLNYIDETEKISLFIDLNI